MGTLIVRNKNGSAWARKWDGQLYEFRPNDDVTIPDEAAVYLFGYGKPNEEKRRILVRNGWQKNSDAESPLGPVKALERLNNFIFRKGPEPKEPEKPAKKVLPGTTGVNAIRPDAKDNGRTILPRGPVKMPGGVADRLPPAVSA